MSKTELLRLAEENLREREEHVALSVAAMSATLAEYDDSVRRQFVAELTRRCGVPTAQRLAEAAAALAEVH